MHLKNFSKSLDLIAENFGFKIGNSAWVSLLYQASKDFTDDELQYGFREMIRISKEEWQKTYGFASKPGVEGFIRFFSLKKLENQTINNSALLRESFLKSRRKDIEKRVRYYLASSSEEEIEKNIEIEMARCEKSDSERLEFDKKFNKVILLNNLQNQDQTRILEIETIPDV